MRLTLLLGVFSCATLPAAAQPAQSNSQAVAEVASGRRTTANAAWWGFNEEDSTAALQAAISSGARRVIIPNMGSGRDWIVRPIKLAGNQELYLEDGVVITAKRGEYRGRGDSVFTADSISNLVIRGYGATVRMQKEDYIMGDVFARLKWDRNFGQYAKAEWRTTLSLLGVTNAEVLGLTLRDSGGDGIYVAGNHSQPFSKNIHLKDVVCENHYRQGISIISVEGLLAESSAFNNTWGTPPAAGVDIEPDAATDRVRDIVFRNCAFEHNYGDGIEIFLANLKASSADVSILFDNCRVRSRRGAGVRVTKVADDGPGGSIEFRNVAIDDTVGYGIKVQDKSARRARVRFVNCSLRKTANNRMYAGAWAPIWLHWFRPHDAANFGGIDFIDCSVEDSRDRPALVFEGPAAKDLPAGPASLPAIIDITGTLSVSNPYAARIALPPKTDNVKLGIKDRDTQQQ
jgi:polygalacturonase